MVLTVLSEEIIAGIVDKYGEVRKLNLSSNGVETLENLSQLSFLCSLNLSCNSISDIAALAALPQLLELDLRDNEITSLSSLRRMKRLERLDISFNNISAMDALRDLSELKQLISLDMAGNPICSNAGRYAEILFLSIPTLQTVDGRTREDILGTLDKSADPPKPPFSANGSGDPNLSANSARPPRDGPPKLSDRLVAEQLLRDNNALSSKVDRLEDLLMTMEQSFADQEAELGRAAASETALPDPGKAKGFSALLRLWRRKLLQTLVARSQLERELGSALHAVDSTRAECASVRQEQQAVLTEAGKKQALFLAENSELRSHISEQEKALITQQQQVQSLQAGIGKRDKDVHLMRLFFDEFRQQLDNNMVNVSQRMLQASGALQLLDARLQSASQRVQLASALVAQNKVHQRNTMAILLAKDSTAISQNKPIINGGAQDSLADLAPEAEALLCSIFRQMDPHDYGYVSIQILVECLLHQNGALLQLVNSALGGGMLPLVLTSAGFDSSGLGRELHWIACGSWAARLLYVLLQILRDPTSDAAPKSGLVVFAGSDITWGEFLLLLAVTREDNSSEISISCLLDNFLRRDGSDGMFHSLSRAERLTLRKRCLLDDHEWAMLPLVIPTDAKVQAESKNPFLPPLWLANAGASIESVGRLKQEALRLSKERAYLLSRVQDMNRTLERRVVAAKEFFANEISAATANEQRYRRELKQVEQREEVLRQKHEELINSSRTQIDRLTERLDEVETSNAAMRSAEERSRGDIESTLHEQLETQRVKHSRLENEHRLLKKESCKLEVLTKTLQRDVQRLQALYTAEAKGRQKVEDREMASSEERKRAVAENESLKDRILHLEAENDRLRNEQRVAEAADVVEPVIKVAAVEDLSLKAPSPTAAVPTTSVVNPINQVARSAAFASTSGGASGIAIDSVMQKLREWTIKLDELDDSQY